MAVQQELWGSETGKAVKNFQVSGAPVPAAVIHWLGRIKAAAARVNAELGLLDADVAERIASGADEIAAGAHERSIRMRAVTSGDQNTEVRELVRARGQCTGSGANSVKIRQIRCFSAHVIRSL